MPQAGISSLSERKTGGITVPLNTTLFTVTLFTLLSVRQLGFTLFHCLTVSRVKLHCSVRLGWCAANIVRQKNSGTFGRILVWNIPEHLGKIRSSGYTAIKLTCNES